jgi:hypothetical protein
MLKKNKPLKYHQSSGDPRGGQVSAVKEKNSQFEPNSNEE